jgi:hypothetical protein
MDGVTIIGVDLAKNVFQLHGAASGSAIGGPDGRDANRRL